MKKIILLTAVLLSGCVVQPPTRVVYVQAPPPPPPPAIYSVPAPQPVVSIYVEPPLYQPPPIRIAWAPPPMLVELPPPLPYFGAVWTGGYWVWEGNWVWAHGRWVGPPQPGYAWVNPYYEHRSGSVIFVNGFWAAPGVSFVAPSVSLNIAFGVVAAGVVAGPRPVGPEGVFIPPPPGSYAGLIVPAPAGTAPAVVTGAPPIVRTGMRVNIVNNNTTTINNVTNVTNVNNVTIVAPASATANGQSVNTAVPALAHMAAAMPPVVKAFAPEPASAKPIPALVPGRAAVVLPTAQMVHAEMVPAGLRLHTADQARMAAPQPGSIPPQSATGPVTHAGVTPPTFTPLATAPQNSTPPAAKPSAPTVAGANTELSKGNENAPLKTVVAANSSGTSDLAKHAVIPKNPTTAASGVKPAKATSNAKPTSKVTDTSQRKPEVKKPEAKKPEVKKPTEAEKTLEKHRRE